MSTDQFVLTVTCLLFSLCNTWINSKLKSGYAKFFTFSNIMIGILLAALILIKSVFTQG